MQLDVSGVASTSSATRLQEPIQEGIQALEHAGLVVGTSTQHGTGYKATRLRQSALGDGRLRQPAGDLT